MFIWPFRKENKDQDRGFQQIGKQSVLHNLANLSPSPVPGPGPGPLSPYLSLSLAPSPTSVFADDDDALSKGWIASSYGQLGKELSRATLSVCT